MSDQIAHIIPTHERPAVCQRLVDSILYHYPDAEIFVCDDSRDPHEYEGAVNVPATAYDIGLSAKRNLLVQSTDHPYLFVWDDDYVCTSNANVEGFLELLLSVEMAGIVAGEWTLESGARNVWFAGPLIPDGAVIRLIPPQDPPQTATTGAGDVRYHRVDLAPNWFLADRRTLRACPWDEELKLNEHLEYFARLCALRGKTYPDASERERRWADRWERLARGEPVVGSSDAGKITIQAKGTFRNRRYLSHLPNNRLVRGDWAEVDREYGKELIEGGKAASLEQEADTRPFPLPDVPEDVPLSVLLTPDFTCRHLRDESRNGTYDEKRFRRSRFMPLQRAKLGVTERDLVQWGKYQYGEPDFEPPEPDLLQKPET